MPCASSSRRRAAASYSWPAIASSFSDGDLLERHLRLLERRRGRCDAQPDARPGLVDQVDRLVRQEAVGDVAGAELGGGAERLVGDLELVVLLVALADAAQDLDRLLDARLVDHHRLEAALEGGVPLDVLAVLVQRGGADALQLAAGERRLEDVRGVDRALGRAGADQRVQLVDEQDAVALASISSMIFLRRSSNSPRYFVPATSEPMSSVSRRLPSSVSGTSPATMRWARPSTMAVLPTPGSPMRAGLFLVRGEDLDDPLDLLRAADDRVELAGARGLGQVDAELVEGRASC